MSDHEYYTPEQIATKLQVRTRTVQEWLRTGRLAGLKLGKLWRVRREDFDAFVGVSQNSVARDSLPHPVVEKGQAEQAAETGCVGERLLAMFDEIFADVPEEDWARMPTDLAEQHDHYAWGLPKRKR
jgi:excisionase family DNA binding protein